MFFKIILIMFVTISNVTSEDFENFDNNEIHSDGAFMNLQTDYSKSVTNKEHGFF